MNTHTPGPWYAEADRSNEGDVIIVTPKARTICEVHNHANAEPGDVEANARLIAAAPALLAAAELALARIAFDASQTNALPPPASKVLSALRAAIASVLA